MSENTRLPWQLVLVVSSLVLWSIQAKPELWTLIAAYAVIWLVASYGFRRHPQLPFTRPRTWFLIALLLAPSLAALHRQQGNFARREDFRGLGEHARDRLRLEALPAIAPPVVFADHPQTFYLHAPDAERATLDLGTGRLPAQALGEGLFRVAYDPRKHGALPAVTGGTEAELQVDVQVDGRTVSRRLGAVRPLAHPRWFAAAPELGLAATVSEETDELLVVSRAGLRHRIAVGDGPTDCAFLADGRLAVSHRYSEELWIVDADRGEVEKQVSLSRFQVRLAASPDGSTLAVAIAGSRPGIRFLDLSAGDDYAEPIEGFVALDFAPDWLAYGPDRNLLVVSSARRKALYRLIRQTAASRWEVADELLLGRPAVTMARSRDGRQMYVAVTDYRSDGKAHDANHFIQDQILTVDVSAWQVTAQHLTARRSSRQNNAGNVDRGVSPMGLAARPDGSLLIAFAGTDEVWAFEPGGAPPEIFSGEDFGLVAPHGVADLGDGYWAASSPLAGEIAVFSAADERVALDHLAATDDELRERDPQALLSRRGERGFYESTRSGISCQSCHLHGDRDHSAHDIGQKPLLHTLSTRGIAGTAPYLRDASFPRIADLHNLARGLYRGYLRRAADRRAAIQAFVESLPRAVNPRAFEPPDLERQRAGVAAFVRASCDLCHTFPAFTNLGQHPTRALFPEYGRTLAPRARLDTASLIGIHDRDHLLQDGRAESITAVLEEHNPANRHGNSAVLSDDERAALVYFLESL